MATTSTRTLSNGAARAKPQPTRREDSASKSHATNGSAPQPRAATLGDLARLLDAELVGDGTTPITGVAGLENPHPGSILFIDSEKLLATALASAAAAIIAPLEVAQNVRDLNGSGKPTLLINNPRLAFARVMELFEPTEKHEPGIHQTAVIEEGAVVSAGATVREYCFVGKNARIERGAMLHPHVYVGESAQIGADVVLFPSVVVGHHVQIGKRVRVHSSSVIGSDGFGYVVDGGKHHKVPQLGTVIVEDDVEIGANVCIDRATLGATLIGQGTKIDNLVQIGHNCQIGKNCIICGHVGLSGSVIIEDDVVLAGQVGVRDHTTIGKGAIIGAQCGVISDIPAGSLMLGSPAVSSREFMKMEAAARKLPEALRSLRNMERQMKQMQQHLDALQNAATGEGIQAIDQPPTS